MRVSGHAEANKLTCTAVTGNSRNLWNEVYLSHFHAIYNVAFNIPSLTIITVVGQQMAQILP